MAGIARVGDILGKGGILTSPFSPDVTVNGRPVALFGAIYTAHPPCSPKSPAHCIGPTFDVPAGVTINGIIPITKSGKGLCGDGVKTASDDVIIVGGGTGGMVGGFALGAAGKALG